MSEDLGTAMRVFYVLFLIATLISMSFVFFVAASAYLEEGTNNLEQYVTSAEDTEITGIIMNEEGFVNVIREPKKSSVIEPLSWKVILNNIDNPDVLLSYKNSDWIYWAIHLTLKITLVALLAGFAVPIIAYKINKLFGGQGDESECSNN